MTAPQERSYRSEEQPTEVFTKIRATGRGVALRRLEEVGNRDLPDARLTTAHRRFVRRLLALAARCLSDEGMMHLAGGAEDVAWRKRAAEEASRR